MGSSQVAYVDKKVSFILAFQFVFIGIKNVLVSAVPFLYQVNEVLNLLLLGIVCILYVYSFFLLRKRNVYIGMLFLGLLVLLSILSTYLFFPENWVFWQQYQMRFLIIIFPSCYLISKLRTLDYFKNYMYLGSYLITVSLVLYAIVVQIIGHSVLSEYSTYSMSMANVAMLGIMWQLREVFKEKSKTALLYAMIGMIVLLLFGSRNQLLAIFAYGILHIIGDSKYKILGFFTLIILAVIVAMFHKEILASIMELCSRWDINSRTIALLLEGGIDESTQIRLDTYAMLRKIIFRNPLIGLGIAGDEANVGELSHSLYYSIWTTYGLFFGTVFILIVLYWCLKGLSKSNGLAHQILVMYMCMVFPRSFTGGDMWGSDVFWVMLGLCFMIIKSSRKSQWQITTTCDKQI